MNEGLHVIGMGFANALMASVVISHKEWRFYSYSARTDSTMEELIEFLNYPADARGKVVMVEGHDIFQELISSGVPFTTASCVVIFDSADVLERVGIPIIDATKPPGAEAYRAHRILPDQANAAFAGQLPDFVTGVVETAPAAPPTPTATVAGAGMPQVPPAPPVAAPVAPALPQVPGATPAPAAPGVPVPAPQQTAPAAPQIPTDVAPAPPVAAPVEAPPTAAPVPPSPEVAATAEAVTLPPAPAPEPELPAQEAPAEEGWEDAWESVTTVDGYIEYWVSTYPGVDDMDQRPGRDVQDLFFLLRQLGDSIGMGRDALWAIHKQTALFGAGATNRTKAKEALKASESWVDEVKAIFDYLDSDYGKHSRRGAFFHLTKGMPIDAAIGRAECWGPDTYYLVWGLSEDTGVTVKQPRIMKKKKKKKS